MLGDWLGDLFDNWSSEDWSSEKILDSSSICSSLEDEDEDEDEISSSINLNICCWSCKSSISLLLIFSVNKFLNILFKSPLINFSYNFINIFIKWMIRFNSFLDCILYISKLILESKYFVIIISAPVSVVVNDFFLKSFFSCLSDHFLYSDAATSILIPVFWEIISINSSSGISIFGSWSTFIILCIVSIFS